MVEKLFKDLAVGDVFMYNNVYWKKLKPKRISCCKAGNNAEKLGTGETHKFRPDIKVLVEENAD